MDATYKTSLEARPSTLWKQARSDAIAVATGTRWCMSCRMLKPYETVKRYRGMRRNVVLRCDACQASRAEGIKAARLRRVV